MNSHIILHYINLYSYYIILLFLICGIVGIPAPEESLLFLVGILIAQQQLKIGYSIAASISGASLGMIVAFTIGKLIGQKFIVKFGRFVGITKDRWELAKKKYEANAKKTITFGFFLPGIRQISPYFAGITGISYKTFFPFALIGASCWVLSFILLGFFIGSMFHVNPNYVPYLGVLLLVIFVSYVLAKRAKTKRKSRS